MTRNIFLVLIFGSLLTGCTFNNGDEKDIINADGTSKNNDSLVNQEDIPDVGGIDYNKALPKNDEVEEVYKESFNLPIHHTVCYPVKKYYCTLNECEEISAEVFNLIGGTRDDLKFSRCDRNPCGTYDVVMDDSGDYKVLLPKNPENSFLFKMSYNTVDKRYTEIVTLGIDSYITYGYCKYDFEL